MRALSFVAGIAFVLGSACLGFVTGANASTITWQLSNNIQLTDGGTLNGSFTLDSAGYLNGSSWNLVITGGSLAGATYTPYINANDPNNLTVVFNGPGYTSLLQLTFEYSLLVPNADNPILGGLNGPSFYCVGFSCTPGDIAYLDSGFDAATVVADPAPLPAAFALFAGGLGLIGLVSQRKRRKTPRPELGL